MSDTAVPPPVPRPSAPTPAPVGLRVPASDPTDWDAVAAEAVARLLAVRGGGLVELLVPGAVLGLSWLGGTRLRLTSSGALVSAASPPGDDGTGGDRTGGSGGWSRTCGGGSARDAARQAVDLAVAVLRDHLGARPRDVEVWRPWSPPPDHGADVAVPRRAASEQGRLWESP